MPHNDLYNRIEYAAMNNSPLHLTDEQTIDLRIKAIPSPTGLHILITNLYWRDEQGNIYRAVLEPRSTALGAGLFVCGSFTLDWFSNGRTNIFRKCYRYYTKI